MKNIIICLLFLILNMPLFSQVETCLEKGHQYFASKEYILAEKTLTKCIDTKNPNSDILISLAGVKMVLGKYDEAGRYFASAVKVLPKDSPYFAYVYSRLGDISMHKTNLKHASSFYEAALKYEPANINALIGFGICREKAGNKLEAASYYRRALAVDFTNLVARQRLVNLEPDVLTEEEILATLKERNIIDPNATEFTEDDLKLLRKMLVAERGRSIDYLAMKYNNNIPEGSIVESEQGKFYARKKLTLTGYKLVVNLLSNDAKNFLVSKGIAGADLFQLRDYDENKLFNEEGILTDEGLLAYTKMLKGQKSYLLPNETAPSRQKAIDLLVQKYLKSGYTEITSREYEEVKRQTLCSEDTLVHSLRVGIIQNKGNSRYFVLNAPSVEIPFIIPYDIVFEYRKKHSMGNNAPTYENTFGMGTSAKMTLCNKNGTLMSLKEIK